MEKIKLSRSDFYQGGTNPSRIVARGFVKNGEVLSGNRAARSVTKQAIGEWASVCTLRPEKRLKTVKKCQVVRHSKK